jgi:hypothetical protein
MSRKPYVQTFDGCSFGYEEVELTGKCKRVTKDGIVDEYAEARLRILGIPLWKYWIFKDDIKWRENEKVEYYDCNFTE